MGLFGSKKKTYRDISYTRLIEDEYLPDVIGQAITTYVLDDENTKPLADLMIEYGWKAINVKENAAYRWADKPGNYYYGTPTSTLVSETDFTGAESLDEVLKSLTGATSLNYIYSNFGPINFRHAMWQLLISNYGYSATDNTLSQLSNTYGSTVYLYNAINYLQTITVNEATQYVLNHWGFSPTSGQTQNRTQDLNRADVADRTSTSGADYIRVEFTYKATEVKHITTVTTTKVDTTVKTPNDSGGYDEETTSNSSDQTSDTTDWGGSSLPPAQNIISQTPTITGSTTNTETDPPTTDTSTDPTTGVITEVTTTVSRKITTDTESIDVVAFLQMDFGQYSFNPDTDIDTDTVLDERDENNYDPTAPLMPSGEDTVSDSDYFQTLFTYQTSSGLQIGYFTYQYGSGSYPDLDGITSTNVKDFGKSFPRLYFRLNGDTITPNNVGQAAYDSTLRYARKLDLDYVEVNESIYDSLSSLNKIRDVMMLQCVPANTKEPIEQEYLFQYFKTLYGLRKPMELPPLIGRDTTDFDTWDAHQGCTLESTDGATTSNIQMLALGYQKISGSIGPVGKTASGRGVGTGIFLTRVSGTQKSYEVRNVNYTYYQLQTSVDSYEETRVYDLAHNVKVGGKYVGRSNDNEEVMVPLDYAFRNMFSPHDRETLYARSTHLLICTEYTVKKKWYQTGIFKAVVIVVAVVLSWWTAGASMSLVAAVTAVATAVGTSIIMSLLSKYVFSKLGGIFAIVATVIAIAVAIYTGYVYLSGTTGPFSMTAMQMMQVSNVAFKAAQSAQQGVIQEEMTKISNLQDEIAQKNSELDAAKAELDSGSMSFANGIFNGNIQGYAYAGENPDQYFSRTLNTNIGVLALNLPDVYLSQGLSLPSDIAILQGIQQNIDKPFELQVGLDNKL